MSAFRNLLRTRLSGASLALSIIACLAGSLSLGLTSVPCSAQTHVAAPQASFGGSGSGILAAMGTGGKRLGQCPLKHTDVKADVSGYVARVSVRQKFQNPFKDKIEAIYTFPLPENAAVDQMTMKVGKRIIRGDIKKREEAREIYEQARASGHVASLLDQERTNIFTQSVANIEPGEEIEIEIKYVDLLAYDGGNFTFNFPTVVGPRFIPGNAVGKEGSGVVPDTDVVPDGSKITPEVAKGTRAGHDISISMNIDAGLPIQSITSKLHEVQLTHPGTAPTAQLKLLDKDAIPNKDFVVSWQVAQDKLSSGYLTHNDSKSGFFTLMMLPPKRVTVENVAPKEMIFVIDCSGSQNGAPLQKCKETMKYILEHMNPDDTFQIISFNSQLREFAERPQKASSAMKERAQTFINSLQANGGTWMAPAVEKVCSMPNDSHRLRIVTFMTDGYVGNDFEIIGMVRKFRGTSRWFPFGTGNSVNRMLIDGIAKEGGGEPDYVLLNSPGDEVGKKFYDRIKSPVLTDVKVEFGDLSVKEVFPHELSDVWAERPLYIKGRYTKPGAGTVTLTGFAGGKPYKQEMKVVFPEKQDENEVLKPMWARAKVDRLMSEDYMGAQRGGVNQELKDEIVKTALDFHIMTQYTSFVAVEEKTVTKDGELKKINVPVEVPDGVSQEAIYGDEGAAGMPPMMGFSGARGLTMGHGGTAALGTAGGSFQKSQGFSSGPVSVLPTVRSGGYAGMAGDALSTGSLGASNFYSAPQSMQIVDARPLVKDFREASSGKPAAMAMIPPSSSPAKEESALKAKVKPEPKLEKAHSSSKIDSKLLGLSAASKSSADLRIENGRVSVSIDLSKASPFVLRKLKELGFELSKTDGTTVSGMLRIEALEAVAKLAEVKAIKPAP